MRFRIFASIIIALLLSQCTRSTESYLKEKLINDGILDRDAQLSVLHESKKPRENDYVIKVFSNNIKGNETIKNKFKKVEHSTKEKVTIVEHLLGKWLPSRSEWESNAYVWVSDKDGTLFYVVFLSQGESIIYVGQR